MEFLRACRNLDRGGWAILAALFLGTPAVLLAFLVVAAHLGVWLALGAFFVAAMILGRTVQMVVDHRARWRYLRPR